MNYVINKSIVFSTAQKMLHLDDSSENSVTLSNQASRLLLEFIKGNRTPLTKEHLLKNVWEDYGLTPSNNNLYMAVSELRKSFSNLGIEETLISTIPKTGFLFEASIDILKNDDKYRKDSIFKTKINIRNIICFFSIAIPLILSFFFMTTRNEVSFRDFLYEKKYSNTFIYGLCEFNAINKDSEKNLNEIMKTLRERNKLECKKRVKKIFYQKTDNALTFIGVCEIDVNNKNSCESIKISKEL
ncbi:winged helix-turn-helix domain-containing protein [Serratia sp. IR-2025]|uniref:winged helix-turn-helix domain-containing protein n=1 Tax=Serratia marcescens TaxID=615 RepID=UPI00387A0658